MRLSPSELPRLAAALGDTAPTATAFHLLTRGECDAWAEFDAGGGLLACVVQAHLYGHAPAAFGDPARIAALLRDVPDWDQVLVDADVAAALPGARVPDLLFALDGGLRAVPHDAVRLLTPADLPLLEAAPDELRRTGWPDLAAALDEAPVAGAIAGGALVATAFASVLTPRFGEIGVATLPEHRGRGYATACASAAAAAVLAPGRTVLWTCDEAHAASLAIARRLGFTTLTRRFYVYRSTTTANPAYSSR